ncbi:MAG: bifunctional 4-hydroxy-2-oxoglutarate aldolase/2-dehydro-3-deoxy-phosphogluconate aldolase [Lentisphaeria bacterium]|jgi:2-dehydro-3-deoxyphosphogluconate aldolase/(4S)-4-hydroxy-2-oxoglutarate aldolase
MDIKAELKKLRVVPVIKLDDAAHAAPLAAALKDGGLPCMEITFRTAAAPEAIKRAAAVPGLLVGAGTVLTAAQVRQALDCGARFIVSPGFSPKVVEACLAAKVPVFPGVCTPTEIQMALDYGLEVLKFFPAENYGGVKTLKALGAVYGGVQFVPTGGIEPHNLLDYLRIPQVLACGGSWLVKAELVNAGKFAEIAKLAGAAVALAAQA